MLVVGSTNSSNSNRLKELAEHCGARSFLIDDAAMLDWAWFDGVNNIGITAGASAPEILVTEIIQAIQSRFKVVKVNNVKGIDENMTFSMPKELRDVPIHNPFKAINTVLETTS